MKSKDMLEDYLLSLGVSIKNKYTFLPKTEYNFNEKKKDETVKLAKYNVKLSEQFANSRELRLMLNCAKDSFIEKVSITKDMHTSCKAIVENSVIYFTDLLKYLDSIIDIKPELMEKLIILCNGGISNVGKEIEQALSSYSIEMTKAQLEGQAEGQRSLEASIMDINSKKSTYVTLDSYHDPIMGNRTMGYVSSGFSDKAFAEGMMLGAQQAAAIIASVPVDVANDKAVEGLKAIRTNILKHFNKSIFELLSAKLPKLFDEDILDNEGNNLEENPTYKNFYLDILSDLKEDQFEDLVKATKYYDINIDKDVKQRVEDNIYNYYINERKCDYDKVDYKLYMYLFKDDNELMTNISSRLKKYFLSVTTNEKKKEVFKSVEEKEKYLNECSYINDADKEEVINKYKNVRKSSTKDDANKKINIILSIISIITVAIGIFLAFRYRSTFMDYPDSNYTYQILFGSAGAAFLTFFAVTCDFEILKKIIMVSLTVISIPLSIYFNNETSKELSFREGKHKVTWNILDDQKVEFIPEGEKIILEKVETGGYHFNGWLCDYKYILTDITAQKETYCNADLKPTSSKLYKVTYKFGNGNKDLKIQYEENDFVYLPQDPTRKGYTFDGWYDVTHKEDINTTFVYGKYYDIVVKAKWKKN